MAGLLRATLIRISRSLTRLTLSRPYAWMGGFVFTHPLPRLLCYNRAMISYELAQELKDAGFPQGAHKLSCYDNGCYEALGNACVPTLEELIEACGESLLVLEREADRWIGRGLAGDTSDYRRAEGSTAAEAIARLWLALHEI
jgi:hypothetical protein